MPTTLGPDAGRISVHLNTTQLASVLDVAEREDRPISRVARALIAEAIEARKAARRSRRGGTPT